MGVKAKRGDTWTRKLAEEFGSFSCDASYRYTFQGKEGEYDKIRLEVTLLEGKPSVPRARPGNPSSKVKKVQLKEGRGEGVLLFDRAAGRLVSWSCELRIDAALVVNIAGNEIDLEISQWQKRTIKITGTNPLSRIKSVGMR